MVLWGRSVLGRQKVPPRFHHFKVPPRLRKFRGVSGLLGRSVLGCQKVPWKVPPRFHRGSTKVAQVSLSLWSSGADPSWAAKRFRGRFHQGFTEVPPRLRKFRYLSGLLGQIRLGLPKGSVEGSTKVSPRFHQGSSKGAPKFHQSSSSFVVSLVLWGRSVLGCQKVAS